MRAVTHQTNGKNPGTLVVEHPDGRGVPEPDAAGEAGAQILLRLYDREEEARREAEALRAKLAEANREAEALRAELAETVRAWRVAEGLSRRALAEEAGVSADTIANIEHARHRPRGEKLGRIRLALVSLAGEPSPDAGLHAASENAPRDGLVLASRTISTTETWSAPCASPEEGGDESAG